MCQTLECTWWTYWWLKWIMNTKYSFQWHWCIIIQQYSTIFKPTGIIRNSLNVSNSIKPKQSIISALHHSFYHKLASSFCFSYGAMVEALAVDYVGYYWCYWCYCRCYDCYDFTFEFVETLWSFLGGSDMNK